MHESKADTAGCSHRTRITIEVEIRCHIEGDGATDHGPYLLLVESQLRSRVEALQKQLVETMVSPKMHNASDFRDRREDNRRLDADVDHGVTDGQREGQGPFQMMVTVPASRS